MSFRVTDAVPPRRYAVVTNSGYFRNAEWRFVLAPIPTGTEVRCSVEFGLRKRYALLGPVLKLVGAQGDPNRSRSPKGRSGSRQAGTLT